MYVVGSKSNPNNKYSTEPKWFEFNGVELLLVRRDNSFPRLVNQVLAEEGEDKITHEEAVLKCLAINNIKDWRGDIVDQEGNDLPYTPDHGFWAMKEDPDLDSFVITITGNTDNWINENASKTAKKSESS